MAAGSRFVVRIAVPALVCASVTAGLIEAPTARADCESISGTMICSHGDRQNDGQSTGPFVPYPCDLDWFCDDDGTDVILGSDGPWGSGGGAHPPDRPDRPRPPRPIRP